MFCLKRGAVIIFLLLTLFLVVSSSAQNYLKPLQGWRIMIDPGAGRELMGPFVGEASGPGGLSESSVNMKIALFLSDFLEKAGAETTMSRQPGESVPVISKRLKTARDFRANLILSIHHDYSDDPDDNYVKAYYYPSGKEPQASIARTLAGTLSSELGIDSHGAEPLSLGILTMTDIPSVMISGGCISNPDYEKKLDDLDYNRNQAIAVLRGMMSFQENVGRMKTQKPPISVTEMEPYSGTQKQVEDKIESPTSLPPLPESDSPMPAPAPLQPLTKQAPTIVQPTEDFQPFLMNPCNARFDQTWLYGESWGNLPVRRGVSFTAPEGTEVRAAADGEVIVSSRNPPREAEHYYNCIIIKHPGLGPGGVDIFTVYGKVRERKAARGDRVSRGDVIGVTGRPSGENYSSRETEFEFQVRWGNNSRADTVNPELFTEHTSRNTGVILGQLTGPDGSPSYSVRINGAKKPEEYSGYAYSLSYARGVPMSMYYNENYAICDVVPGIYVLTAGQKAEKVRVEAGRITRLEW